MVSTIVKAIFSAMVSAIFDHVTMRSLHSHHTEYMPYLYPIKQHIWALSLHPACAHLHAVRPAVVIARCCTEGGVSVLACIAIAAKDGFIAGEHHL